MSEKLTATTTIIKTSKTFMKMKECRQEIFQNELAKQSTFFYVNSSINRLVIMLSFYLRKCSSTQASLAMNIIPSYLIWKACSI